MRKWSIGWGTVSRCNMNCLFCYSKFKRKSSNDLSYNDWIRFIDENYDKISSINFGTGENTLNESWFELVAYIRKNFPEIRQALTTNGYLIEAINKSKCMQAFLDGIDEVDVSLDFCDPDKHTGFRGQPKAFDWAIRTLALCKKYQKPATIVFLGSEQNITFPNLDGLFNIAKEYRAILRMNMYRPTEGVNDFSKKFIISYSTFVDALKYIACKYSIISMNDTLFSSILTNQTVTDPSGDRSIRILADGSITPSTYLIKDDYIVANITDAHALEKLEQNQSLSDLIVKTIPDECKGCIYELACAGGVYDRRYLWHGTLNKRDPYCPGPFSRRTDDPLKITASDFKSVHNGYLPTIFFKPKED